MKISISNRFDSITLVKVIYDVIEIDATRRTSSKSMKIDWTSLNVWIELFHQGEQEQEQNWLD